MDPQTLQEGLNQAGLGALGIGFIAGFLFSFNPVAFAAIPVSLAYVTKARDVKKALILGTAFIVGMIAIHAALGLIASLGGQWVQALLGRYWALLLGPALIFLGLLWPGWVKVRLPAVPVRAKPATGLLGAAVLGVLFSVAICPFCTPALIVLLGVAAALGSPGFGVALLLAFALGRAVPILIGAVSVGWLESLKGLSRYQRWFEATGGLILILTGLYLLNAYFFVFPQLAV
jgi:cytochrome c-type biogenesis protein